MTGTSVHPAERAVPRRRAAVLVLAALAVLAAAWSVTPHAVPLYDGVGFPDEPYRYVAPPAGYRHTPPPSAASNVAVIQHGMNAYPFYLNTGEQGPQFSMLVPDHVVAVGAGVDKVRFTATPRRPDAPPSGGTIDGNDYRVSVAAPAGRTVTFITASNAPTLQMRATSPRQPGPTMIYRAAGQGWRSLPTSQVGADIYAASAPGLGDYALAYATGAAARSAGRARGGTPYGLLAVLGVVVATMAGVVLAVRRSRGRTPP